jgi:RNA polymerase sigma-70 factor, ECF subfamily
MSMSQIKNALLGTLQAGAERAGADEDFASRVLENQKRVFQIAYSVLGNAADAEEVVQEAFLRAFQKSGLLRDAGKFRAWINRISFRMALNRLRAAKRQLARDDAWQAHRVENEDGARAAEDRVMLERLQEEIAKLPERLRSVLLLSLAEEMEPTDVAAALGLPAGTVRSRLHAARKLLLEAMR